LPEADFKPTKIVDLIQVKLIEKPEKYIFKRIMDPDKLNIAAEKPDLYEKGDAIIWTDEYISTKLLELHLDPGIDSASRMPESINRTLELIGTFCGDSPKSILDLGCGPGLYLEPLAAKGHQCTGVDFSERSINYARNQATKKGLDITYLCQDYLELDFDRQFDLILLIYTDLCVLLPEERSELLNRIKRALKPGGIFFFDVLNDRNIEEKFEETQILTYEFSGFWKPTPYLEFEKGFHYPEHKVFLRQHTIIDESDQVRNYRFWTHYFSREDIFKMLSSSGFIHIEPYENKLPAKDIWDGENVTFYKTQKA
jgi:2-polyprenyl-3-methyl-5-hydroxy-6-metoxy-1,4-benzoquinol methylase